VRPLDRGRKLTRGIPDRPAGPRLEQTGARVAHNRRSGIHTRPSSADRRPIPDDIAQVAPTAPGTGRSSHGTARTGRGRGRASVRDGGVGGFHRCHGNRLGEGYDEIVCATRARRVRSIDGMDDRAQPPRRAGRTGRMVGHVLGIPLYINLSMLFLAALVTLVYGNYVREQLDVPAPAGYAIGLGFVTCLLGSVLLHELGHALTARRHGIGVRGITLELLGGWTEMDRDAPSPRVDALVSLAGPAVSLVLGGLGTAAAFALPDRTVAGEVAFQLAAANVLVAVFNVLPGLPLDGGRALRAGIWALIKDRDRATEVAGWAGRGIALVTGVLVLMLYRHNVITLFGVVFVLLVVFTLWQGAGQSIRLARMTRRFPLVDLKVLAKPVYAVPAGTPLSEALRRAGEDGPRGAAPAIADSSGRIVALIDPVAVGRVPVGRRPWVAVDTVARGVDGLTAMPLTLTGQQVVRVVQAHPGAQYLVTSGEDVVGVLHVADLATVLEPRRPGGRPARAGH
jgi:Zn-dependent protease